MLLSGWTLRKNKEHTVFTPYQKTFLLAKFNDGILNRKKFNAADIAEEMRRIGQFEKKNFLTKQQIASFWSREAAKRRNPLKMQEHPTTDDPTADDNDYITDVDAVKDPAFQDEIIIEIMENLKESDRVF